MTGEMKWTWYTVPRRWRVVREPSSSLGPAETIRTTWRRVTAESFARWMNSAMPQQHYVVERGNRRPGETE